jgi:hypothetical protein
MSWGGGVQAEGRLLVCVRCKATRPQLQLNSCVGEFLAGMQVGL